MKHRTTLVAICLEMVGFTAYAGNVLWYRQPATKWMEAIPTGNGRLATMVYGGIDRETVALNEISLWSGQPDSTNNDMGGRDKLDEIRRCFFNDDPEQGNKLGEKYFTGKGKSFGTHLPLGDLVIDFVYPSGLVKNYRRELDMDNAVAAVTFERSGIRYHREYISDHPDDVIAMRVTADKQGAISAKVGLNLLREADVTPTPAGLKLKGKVKFHMHGEGGVEFCGEVRLLPEGGQVTADGTSVSVKDADALTILVDVRTNYNRTDYEDVC